MRAIATSLVCLGLAGAAALGCADRETVDAAPPRRVVLIVIDTLRADHLGVYGYEKETAPFLGRLAAMGTVFDRAHSTSSWTAPSTASIMTGLYPTRHGVVEGFFAHRQRESRGAVEGHAVQPLARLPSDTRLLAERFADAGYRTFGAASNLNIGPALGFDRGFERFIDAQNRPAEALLAQVAAWPELHADGDARSLLYLHLNDVHVPYEPRAPWYDTGAAGRGDDVAAYDSEIAYVDHHLAELAEQLGWNDDTLVVVVSDHGEEFGDHGGRRHDGGLHEELTRVVMIFSGAGVPRARIDVDVSLVDVLPTLLELCGISADDGALDGRSLTPLMSAWASGDIDVRDVFSDRPLLAHRAKMGREYGAHWWAIVLDGWKLIVDGDARALYDQRADRRETDDRAAAEPERLRALTEHLDALREGGIRRDGDRTEVTLDEEMLEALESLGYVERPVEEPVEAPAEEPIEEPADRAEEAEASDTEHPDGE